MNQYSCMGRYAPREGFRIMPITYDWNSGEPFFYEASYKSNFRSINVCNPSSYLSGGISRDIPSSGIAGIAVRIPQFMRNNDPIVKIGTTGGYAYLAVNNGRLVVGTSATPTGPNVIATTSSISAGEVDAWFYCEFNLSGTMSVRVNGSSTISGGSIPAGDKRMTLVSSSSLYAGVRFADFKYEDDGRSGPVRMLSSFSNQREYMSGFTGVDDTALRPTRIECNFIGTSNEDPLADPTEARYAYNGTSSGVGPSPVWNPDISYTSIVASQMDAIAGAVPSFSSNLSLRIRTATMEVEQNFGSLINAAPLDRAWVSLICYTDPSTGLPWTISDLQLAKTSVLER